MPDPVKPSPRPVPERFLASKGTLRLDRFMTHAIKIGGFLIIIAVFGIFAFIFVEIIPLFGGAHVGRMESFPVGATNAQLLGVDEWGQKPFIYEGTAEIKVADLANKGSLETLALTLPQGT